MVSASSLEDVGYILNSLFFLKNHLVLSLSFYVPSDDITESLIGLLGSPSLRPLYMRI